MTTPRSSFGMRRKKALLWLYDKLNRRLAAVVGRKQTESILKEFGLRDDDIFIVTYMKSGTTLLQMLLYQLMTDGRMDFEHIYEKSPYLDKNVIQNEPIDDYPSPRIIKTHFTHQSFPENSPGKYIVCTRNGMDVAVSKYHHMKNYYFPSLTWEEYHRDVWMNPADSWFKYVKEWLDNKLKLNVHYIFYEDLINNKRGVIEGIAKFIGISPSEETIQRVIERSGFAYMKEHEDKFGEPMPERYHPVYFDAGFSRKYFTPQQQSMFTQFYQQQLGRFGLRHGLTTKPLNNATIEARQA
jgi:hypothetical protein